MTFFIKFIKFLCLFMGLGAIILLFMVVETEPQLQQRVRLSSASAADAKQIIQRTARQIRQGGKSQYTFTHSELQSLSMLANKLSPKIDTNVMLSASKALFYGYIKPFRSELYLNFSLALPDSESGLVFGEAGIGRLTLNGQWLFETAMALLSDKLKPEHYELLEMVQKVNVNQQQLQIDIDQGENSLADTGRLANLLSLKNSLVAGVNQESVQHYYQNLLGFAQLPKRDKSLLYFLKHQFSEATKNSLAQGRRAVEENRDAMMALALYFGSNKFALVTGKMQPLSRQQQVMRNNHKRSITLLKRNDLQKHFIYSMALQLLSDANAGFALGEFKELLDSNSGGSGFSFVDLYADRAGTRLAQYATQNESSARAIQQTFAEMENEDQLIPFPRDLPEGIDAERFSVDYVNTQSPSYRQMLALIDEQLSSLHFYAPVD
ncbi:hypothetical protein [Thalassotalea mangrovi]|uniref:Uncharacterized protein n=1 Tax=Thalassotalea mangrovi TaxID=2572245 RepID=A0A4U1B1R2_9GAMM|nr:hypothetical protein [Thalassotalea mangrovi]TKB43421.1 hypothetical protein E8M12_14820 [Thalassotalea mangrovi]